MIDNIKKFFIGLCYVVGCYLVLLAVVIIYSYSKKIIKEYNSNVKLLNNKINKLTTQRNVIGLGGIISILALIIFIK